MQDLADWLHERLVKLNLKQIELGQRLGHANNSVVSYVLSRKLTIDEDKFPLWIAALELDDDQAKVFTKLALLELSPPTVRRMYLDERQKAEMARTEALEARERVERLLTELGKRDAKIAELTELVRRYQQLLQIDPPAHQMP